MPPMDVSNLRSNVFSALIVFDLFFLEPVLGGHTVLSIAVLSYQKNRAV